MYGDLPGQSRSCRVKSGLQILHNISGLAAVGEANFSMEAAAAWPAPQLPKLKGTAGREMSPLAHGAARAKQTPRFGLQESTIDFIGHAVALLGAQHTAISKA